MWFDDEDIFTRRLFTAKRNRRRKPVLQVNARLSTQKKTRRHRVAVFVLVPTIILVAGLLVWKGLGLAGEMVFSKNDRFKIAHLDIRTQKGAVISPTLVREYTQLREGKNLFEFNIREIRNDFMENMPNLKSMIITRHLPDTLTIDMVERVPLARMGSSKTLVADSEGCVFAKSGALGLPVVTGYQDKKLGPGSRIQDMGLAALQVLDACSDPDLGLNVDSVRVTKRDYVVVRIRYDGKRKELDLKWTDMGDRTFISGQDLLKQLNRWARLLETKKSRKHTRFDGTFSDRMYGKGR